MSPGSTRRTWFDRHLFQLALALALLPLLVSAIALVFGVGNGYLPTADHALTEMQVRDVGRRAVLVGLYSRADWSHPGPMLFYFLAPLYRITGGASISMHLGALIINAASISGMALIARRRAGTPLMLFTLIGCGVLVRTLGASFVHDPWNNYVTTLPFGLMIFLAWSLTCGDVWALPVAVTVATFLAQTHVGFVALAVPLLAWGTAWLVIVTMRADDGEGRRRDLIRSALFSVGVLAVLWLPPLVDMAVHSPSNASRILRWFRRADEGTHTLAQGWRVIAGQFELRPEWVTHARTPWPFTGEPAFLYAAPRPWLLPLVGLAGWALWRRCRGDGWRLAMTVGVALCLGVLAVARTVGPAFDYRLRWTWVLAMVASVVVLWAAWLMIQRFPDDQGPPRGIASRGQGAAIRGLGGVSIAALLVLSAVNTVTAARAGTPYRPESSVLAGLMPPVLRAVGQGTGEVLVSDTDAGSWYTRGLVLQLERHGIAARVPGNRAALFGRHRMFHRGRVRARLLVAVDSEIPGLAKRPGVRLLARWDSVPPAKQRRVNERLAELDADLKAGRLTDADHYRASRSLNLSLHRRGNAALYAVAVFLDEQYGR